jgi:hypothetical protein
LTIFWQFFTLPLAERNSAPPGRTVSHHRLAGQYPHDEECAMSQRTCPITRSQFRSNAKPMPVQINGASLLADVKEFSTGSLGWNHSGKCVVEIDGVQCWVQIGLNVTLIGSKELPQDTPAAKVA